MNKTLLRKVKKQILEEPKRLDMGFFGMKVKPYSGGPRCGTVGCIAGWAVMLNHPEVIGARLSEKRLDEFNNLIGRADVEGMKLLKITTDQRDKLFYVANWPEPYRQQYSDAIDDRKARAEVTAKRIDYFIKTGE